MPGMSRELLINLFLIKGIIIWSGINVWQQAVWLGKHFGIHTFKCLIAIEEPAFLACSMYLVCKNIQSIFDLEAINLFWAHGFWIDIGIIGVFKLQKMCSIFPSVYRWKKMWEGSLGERKTLLLSKKSTSHVWKEVDPLNLSSPLCCKLMLETRHEQGENCWYCFVLES